MLKAASFATLISLLVGCTAAPVRIETGGATPIQLGSTIKLTRSLTIPGGNAAVYIQNGETVSPGSHDQYYAYCRLIMKTLSSAPRTVSPATFRVIDIQQEIEDVQLRQLKYAGLGINLSNGATADEYSTTFYLKSTKEPDVDRLVCAHWEDPTLSPLHLNAKQIRDTLAGLLIFQ